jgi:hypothetical protein
MGTNFSNIGGGQASAEGIRFGMIGMEGDNLRQGWTKICRNLIKNCSDNEGWDKLCQNKTVHNKGGTNFDIWAQLAQFDMMEETKVGRG